MKQKMIKVPQQFMTSYDRITNERPAKNFYHWSITVCTGLSLAILLYVVIICGRTLIIFYETKLKTVIHKLMYIN